MNPGTLALFSRTLRRGVVLWEPHVVRAGFAGMVLVLLFFAQAGGLMFGAPGLRFFRFILGLNLIVISLAGVGLFSSVISEEKEDASLGLLRMAGISHLGLMLGKSTGLLVLALVLLAVQFPFTLLAVTLGGVTFGQLTAGYLALAAYLVFVANAGLLCSTVCRRTGSAAIVMVLLIGTVVFLPVGLHGLLAARVAAGGLSEPARLGAAVVEALDEGSVLRRIVTITRTGWAESPVSPQVVGNVAAAAVFFLLAWATFDRFARGADPSAPPMTAVRKPAGGLGRLRAGRVWANPFTWKEFYFLTGGTRVMAVKALAYGAAVIGVRIAYALWPSAFPAEVAAAYLVIGLMTAALAVELCIDAARIFNDEIRCRTLPTLMMLPVSMRHIIFSKLAGCLPALAPAAVILVVGAAICPQGWTTLGRLAVSPVAWLGALNFILLLQCTIRLSLTFKWWELTVIIFGIAGHLTMPLLGIAVLIESERLGYLIIPPAVLAYLGLIWLVQRGLDSTLETAATQ